MEEGGEKAESDGEADFERRSQTSRRSRRGSTECEREGERKGERETLDLGLYIVLLMSFARLGLGCRIYGDGPLSVRLRKLILGCGRLIMSASENISFSEAVVLKLPPLKIDFLR